MTITLARGDIKFVARDEAQAAGNVLDVSSSDEEAAVRPEAPAKDSSDEEAFFDEEADHEEVPQKSGHRRPNQGSQEGSTDQG